MERVQLGNSDIKVSPVCVGCWQFNGGAQSADKTWNPQTEQVRFNASSIVDFVSLLIDDVVHVTCVLINIVVTQCTSCCHHGYITQIAYVPA